MRLNSLKRISNYFLIIFLGMLFFIKSCDYKKTAIGDDRQIFVFADSLLWLDVKNEVEETFYNYVYTPRAEKSFVLSYRSLSKLNDLNGRRNLLFIGTTESGTQVNEYLLQIIPPEFVNSVNNDKGFYFFKDNLFLHQQISMFMLGKDKDHFLRNFRANRKDIFNNFNNKYISRLKERMYDKGEQTELEDYLINNFGYKIRVQHDYFLANQEPLENFVWLRRLDPDRWISIWKKNLQEVNFSPDSLFTIRNEMTKKYYDGDVVVTEETNIEKQLFIGKNTTKITGTWRNDSLIVGGPFRTYVVSKEEDNSVYFIDIAVMAPSKDKKVYLDQLEVIANTFTFTD